MIVSYQSGGLYTLARQLNIKRQVYRGTRSYGTQELTHVINWGIQPAGLRRFTLNKPILNADISTATSKIKSFEAVDVRTPRVFQDAQEAAEAGIPYLARQDHMTQGRGITYHQAGEQSSEQADFYVEYIHRRYEVRIHVWCGDVIATQYKRQSPGAVICNHTAGAFFLTWPLEGYLGTKNAQRAKDMAVQAVEEVGLDFGAVDILYGEDRKLYFLEVNTAPAVESDSMKQVYTDILRRYYASI